MLFFSAQQKQQNDRSQLEIENNSQKMSDK